MVRSGCPAGFPCQRRPAPPRPDDLPLGGFVVALRDREPAITVSKVVERTLRACRAVAAPARRWSSSSTRWASTSPAAATRSKTCVPPSRSSARSARTCSRPARSSPRAGSSSPRRRSSTRWSPPSTRSGSNWRSSRTASATGSISPRPTSGRSPRSGCWRRRTTAVPVLKKLFAENQGQLNAALRLERTTRKTEINEADFVQLLPVPAALHRPLHRHHVGHPAPARCTPALRRQQPDDHQASLRDARVRPHGHGDEAGRHPGHARQGVRTGRGQPLQREAHRHPRHRPAVQGRSRGPGLGAAGRQGRLPPGVRPGPAPHRGEHRRLPGRSRWASPPRWPR